jgi:hypothetical protein
MNWRFAVPARVDAIAAERVGGQFRCAPLNCLRHFASIPWPIGQDEAEGFTSS